MSVGRAIGRGLYRIDPGRPTISLASVRRGGIMIMNMFIIKNAVPKTVGRVRVDPVKILWMWGMLFAGAVVGLPALNGRLTALSLALTFLTLCLGHSVGLHRGFIHRSYEVRPAVRAFLAWLFVLTGLG